jgi:hypothetical protein
MANTNIITAENIKKIIEDNDFNLASAETFSTYDFSYKYLLEIFKDLTTKGDLKQWLIGGSSIIYSWMPTILNFSKGSDDDEKANTHLKECIKALKFIKKEIAGDFVKLLNNPAFYTKDKECHINTLTSFINNSIVGTSKFLHFSFPEHFPIWDSRVERATRFIKKDGKPELIKDVKKNDYQTNKVDNYIAYCKAVNELISKYPAFLKDIDGKLDGGKKETTPIRKIENALFIIGGKK